MRHLRLIYESRVNWACPEYSRLPGGVGGAGYSEEGWETVGWGGDLVHCM